MEPYRLFIGIMVGVIPLLLVNGVNGAIDCSEIKTESGQAKCHELTGQMWLGALPFSAVLMFFSLRGLRQEQSWYEYPCGKCGKIIAKGTNPCPKCGEKLFWLPETKDHTPCPDYSFGMKEKERMENEAIEQRYAKMPELEE